MIFPGSRTPRKRVDVLLDRISSGRCDDLTLKEFKEIVDDIHNPTEIERISRALQKNIEDSSNPIVLNYTIRAIQHLLPLDPWIEEKLTRQLMAILRVQQSTPYKPLHEAISSYMLTMVLANIENAQQMMPLLIVCLDDRYGTIGNNAYDALKMVAVKKPEYYQPYTGALIKMLGSINKSTRTETARLIGIIAKKYPDYVENALPTLEYLANFYPDSYVKKVASEAYQILSGKIKENTGEQPVIEITEQASSKASDLTDLYKRKPEEEIASGADIKDAEKPVEPVEYKGIAAGLKDCVKPRTGEEQKLPQHVPPQNIDEIEMEIKELLDKVKDDFSTNAGTILDSIGMKHLAEQQNAPEPVEKHVQKPPKAVKAVKKEHEKPPVKEMPEKKPEPKTVTPAHVKPEKHEAKPQPEAKKAPRQFKRVTIPEKMAKRWNESRNIAYINKSNYAQAKEEDSVKPEPKLEMAIKPESKPEAIAKGFKEIKPEAIHSSQAIVKAAPVKPVAEAVAKPAKVIKEEKLKVEPVKEEKPEKAIMKEKPAEEIKQEQKKQPEPVKVPEKEKVAPKPVIPTGCVMPAAKPNIDEPRPEVKPILKPSLINIKTYRDRPADGDKKEPFNPATVKPQVSENKAVPEAQEHKKEDRIECPTCHTILPGDAQFCMSCGTRVREKGKNKCLKCGTINLVHARFCINCGNPFTEDETVQGHYNI